MTIRVSQERCEKKTYKKNRRMSQKSHGANCTKTMENREYDDYFLFDVMHVGVKGWMEVEKRTFTKFAKPS